MDSAPVSGKDTARYTLPTTRRISRQLRHGQADDKLLAGRDFKPRRWYDAFSDLRRLERAVVDADERVAEGQVLIESALNAAADALERARADLLAVNAAGFDSTRGELTLAAIKRIDAFLAGDPIS